MQATCREKRHTSARERTTQTDARRSALPAYVARLESARVPKLVVHVGGAEPALAFLTEQRRGGVAGFIEMRDAFAKRFASLAGVFFGRLCFHGRICGDILLLPALEVDSHPISRDAPNSRMNKSAPAGSVLRLQVWLQK